MAGASRTSGIAPLGLRAARAPGALPVARALPLQFLPSSGEVRAPLPPAIPGAPRARGPAAARARTAGSAGGSAARGLGPGPAPSPRFPAQLGGRSLHSIQPSACQVRRSRLRLPMSPKPAILPARGSGTVVAAAVLPGDLCGGRTSRGGHLAAPTARLPAQPFPPAVLLGDCLPAPSTLCQPQPLAHWNLGASSTQRQDPGARYWLQGQWGAGRGQQGSLWDTRFSKVLHLEADLQPGIRSVRLQQLWFLLDWILWLALARFEGTDKLGLLWLLL